MNQINRQNLCPEIEVKRLIENYCELMIDEEQKVFRQNENKINYREHGNFSHAYCYKNTFHEKQPLFSPLLILFHPLIFSFVKQQGHLKKNLLLVLCSYSAIY